MKVCYQNKKDINPCSPTYGQVKRFVVPCPPGIICGGQNQQQADLSLEYVSDTLNPFTGQTIVFTIKLSNIGPGIPSTVELRGVLPVGIDFVSSASGITYSPFNRELSVVIRNPPIGDSTFTFLGKAVATKPGNYRTVFQVYSSSLPDPDSVPGMGINEDDSDYIDINIQSNTTLSPSNNCAKYRIQQLGTTNCFEVIAELTAVNPLESHVVLVEYSFGEVNQPRQGSYISFLMGPGETTKSSGCLPQSNFVQVSSFEVLVLSTGAKLGICE